MNAIKNPKLIQRVLYLCLLGVLGMVVITVLMLSSNRNQMFEDRELMLHAQLDSALNIVNYHASLVPQIGLEEAQKRTLTLLN